VNDLRKTLFQHIKLTGALLRKILTDGDRLIYLLVIGSTFLFSYFAVSRLVTFDHPGWWDIGVLNQSLWTTLHYGVVNGQILWNSINYGQLPIHLSLILLLQLPAYAIYQSPETMLVFGSFILRLGALPLYWLSRDEFNSKRIGLLFALVYLTYGLQLGISWSFHPDAAIPAMLLFSFYFLKKRDWPKYFVFLLLTLMTKEIVVLVTVPLGIYGLLFNQAESTPKRKFLNWDVICPLLTIALSVIWFIMATAVMGYFVSITPWVQAGELPPHHMIPWSHFGNNTSSIVQGILLNPSDTLSVLLANLVRVNPLDGYPNYVYILRFLAPLAFLPLLSPRTLFIPVPYVLFFLISNEPNFWRLGIHYATPVWPFLFIAALYGFKHLATKGLPFASRFKR
jgi:uncharacterized membrane protein